LGIDTAARFANGHGLCKSLSTEYGVGDYERSFTLPNEIDRECIQATVKHGVLKLTLPKAQQAVAKKITVAAG
jgi:HSP20 family protein